MDIQAIGSKFAGFLTHYGSEISGVASALETIVSHLPIDHADRDRIVEVVTNLQEAAVKVSAGAASFSGLEVVVKASDVDAAANAYLDTHLQPAIERAVADYIVAHPPVAPVAPPVA